MAQIISGGGDTSGGGGSAATSPTPVIVLEPSATPTPNPYSTLNFNDPLVWVGGLAAIGLTLYLLSKTGALKKVKMPKIRIGRR
jgi:hypothetical protein